jgi:hypothetical protein
MGRLERMQAGMKEFTFSTGEGKYRTSLHAWYCGDDVSVCISGGDVQHIGAVAVAVPRKSLTGDGSGSASASVICITGHKEDELARSAALRLSSLWQCVVTVSAGVHVDNASKGDIDILRLNIEELMENFIGKVKPEQYK